MTNEEKRVKIACRLGWIHRPGAKLPWALEIGPRGGIYQATPPSFFSDLNDTRWAWLQLDDGQRFLYRTKLTEVLMESADGQTWYEGATAAQQTEAIGRALALW